MGRRRPRTLPPAAVGDLADFRARRAALSPRAYLSASPGDPDASIARRRALMDLDAEECAAGLHPWHPSGIGPCQPSAEAS